MNLPNDEGGVNDVLPSYEPPNLEEAKRYRDSTLPRRLRDPSQPNGFRLAGMGEDKDQFGNIAQKYPLFCSKTDVLNEFGVGVSLYFKTLKVLFCLLFLCAFISLVSKKKEREKKKREKDIFYIYIINFVDCNVSKSKI